MKRCARKTVVLPYGLVDTDDTHTVTESDISDLETLNLLAVPSKNTLGMDTSGQHTQGSTDFSQEAIFPLKAITSRQKPGSPVKPSTSHQKPGSLLCFDHTGSSDDFYTKNANQAATVGNGVSGQEQPKPHLKKLKTSLGLNTQEFQPKGEAIKHDLLQSTSTFADNKTSRKRAPNETWRCGGCQQKGDCGFCDSCTAINPDVGFGGRKFIQRQFSSFYSDSTEASEEASKSGKKRAKSSLMAEGKGLYDVKKGVRVYARWHENDQWYWGTVVRVITLDKNTENTSQSKRRFDIEFDDGDLRIGTPIEDIETENSSIVKMLPKLREEARRQKELYEKKMAEKQEIKKRRPSKRGTVYVGARCYSKFTTGRWHWGKITKIEGEGIDMKCSVLYDDGDTRDGIRRFDELKLLHEVASIKRSFADLEATRCGNCSRCKLSDCGACDCCMFNKNSTTTNRESCHFRICLNANITMAVPNFPKGWKYEFVDNSDPRPADARPPLHPSLAGFRVYDPTWKRQNGEGQTYYNLEDPGATLGMATPLIRHAEEDLYEKRFGLKIRHPVDHFLLGKGFVQEWLHTSGSQNILYGIIESCERNPFDGDRLVFKVRYKNAEESETVKHSGLKGISIPEVGEVSERLAWAGCILFDQKTDNSRSSSILREELAKTSCVPFRWMVPDSVESELMDPDRFSDGYFRPKQISVFRETMLEFETRKSSIAGAGLGVFLRCSNLSPTFKENFRLENGELLDIGIYAPLTENDFKDGSLFLFKNFIHGGECESWSFDAIGCAHGTKVFDITDDVTGDLHNIARNSLPSYVNETNGKETPSVRADHDPEGSVHYLLGHYEVHQGPLIVPFSTWVEIKIDYGPMYEPVRVRKGYSRLTAAQLLKEVQRHESDNKETLKDVGSWSVRDVELCISFLEKLDIKRLRDSAKIRALVISIRVCLHLLEVKEEFTAFVCLNKSASALFCDNGYSTLERNEVITRAKRCIDALLNLWIDSAKLKNDLLREEVYALYVAEFFRLDLGMMKKTEPQLLSEILRTRLGLQPPDCKTSTVQTSDADQGRSTVSHPL